jgi:small subunit ribosomal protein S8
MPLLNDPIGDLLTRMRNAQHARRNFCEAPLSNIKKDLCDLLVREGYLEKVEVTGEAPKQNLMVTFIPGKTLTLKRVSTPGRRAYHSADELQPVMHGYGMSVITTSSGLLTDKEARAKHVGGEVLCTIS